MLAPDSRSRRALELAADFLLLSLLWLLASAPIVTLLPATAALFGVVRDRVCEQEPPEIGRFFALFRENFAQSLQVGGGWLALGLLLAANAYLATQMTWGIRYPALLVIAVVGLLYVAMTPYLFPVLVHYGTNATGVIRLAFATALNQPASTLLATTLLLLFVGLCLVVPGFLLAGSVVAQLLYRICDRAFRRMGLVTAD